MSQKDVVEASRFFVCVRPQTYENKEEAKILEYVFSGRDGLENTSFALIKPDGKKITRGSRSPRMSYGTSEAFVKALKDTAKKYAGKSKTIKQLPTLRNLRLALNVAAADMRPLVIVRGKDKKSAAKLKEQVAKLSWSKKLVGTFHYVVLEKKTTLGGLTPALGVSIVQPDSYGQGGKTLAKLSATASKASMKKAFSKVLSKYKVESRSHRDHVREARRKGITWETAIPVTDKGGRGRR